LHDQGIGEPPLGLAASVFFAIKYAIESARKDAGVTGPFNLESPATAERIRMACVDHLTAQVRDPSFVNVLQKCRFALVKNLSNS
jgi:xanthine dehydrogenase molybdopterin-binding subunit B